MASLNLAVIGCGAWGINHVRTAHALGELKTVCDFNPEAQAKVQAIAPGISFTKDLNAVLEDDSVQAVVVATPAETHFAIAKACILHGKHVLVEKPITLTSDHARELIALADEHGVHLMVGHVLLYHPAVVTLKRMVDTGTIGKLQYIYSNRLNLGAIRHEENSLWSFAPHDISIVQHLIGRDPETIDAKGSAFVQPDVEDSTITYLTYPDNIHVHIFVSWLHPFKEQRLVVIGDKGMIVFEDSLKTDKLKFYRKGFVNTNGTIEKFDVDYEVVPFGGEQPLAEEHRHFYQCIRNHETPLTDGRHALAVLDILEQAQSRLKHHV